MNRRQAIGSFAGAVAATAAIAHSSDAKGGDKPAAFTPVAAGGHKPVPLPFAPGKLPGLSEKLLTSHHDNNYASAVKNLVKVRQEIAATNKDTPPFVVGALRERELQFFGSMVLHELYFGNLGGDGKIGGALKAALPADWEERLRATAMSLGGGSGWACLALSFHTGEIVVTWSGNHTQSLASSQPLLVLDMYEHAYALDYGADHAPYIDALFKNLAWDVVETRYDRAMKALAALG